METQSISKPVWWTGTIVKGLLCLFLAFDAIMKVIQHPLSVEGTKQLGLPESCVPVLGVYLLISTLFYIFSKTVVIGMLFLSAYLGAAVAITYRAAINGHSYVFPIVFMVLIVVAEYLRNEKVRKTALIVK